ncbi:MAG: hypothetical protein K5911_10350 [Eubacteriales bacterium]|nr:hypothetical protein [Eubacteriales bacterium]
MTYPRPLSDKNLEKKYEEAHITDEMSAFLHEFFSSCANLYGAIAIEDMWQIYRDLREHFPEVRKNHFAAFVSIVRREVQPYRVYRHDELYGKDENDISGDWLLHKDLTGEGSRRFVPFFDLLKARGNRPYYVPDDLMGYAQGGYSENDRSFLEYLSCIVSMKDFNDCGVPNVNKGKMLGEFSRLNVSERYKIDRIRDRDAQFAAIREKTRLCAAEKILKDIILVNNIGLIPPSFHLIRILSDLSDAWVYTDELQRKELRKVFADHYNHSRLWCLAGWTPAELNLTCKRMHEAIEFGLRS